MKPFHGNLLDFKNDMILLPEHDSKIEESDINWIKMYFEIANKMAAQSDNFRFALETINSWRYANDFKSAIAILWAAIESLIGVSSEIVFRISLSISSILIEKGENRLNKFNEIKKLYGLRSKIVHGSTLKSNEINIALEQSFNLLRNLVVYMIENKKILNKSDFERAIFY